HSWYGARWGKLFSETLAHKGITITSGLALGIDGVAHRGALAAAWTGAASRGPRHDDGPARPDRLTSPRVPGPVVFLVG
ncbi:DNA-processing protein DprA, partial [Mycobacterium tuberculosis]|nr:DNA-processing protein DprA [Mycobacterium tuberculosis]